MKIALPCLLILSTLCLAASSRAGQDAVDAKASSKEVIQKPAPKPPRFYLSLDAGGEFDEHATKFISNGGGDLGVPGSFSLPTKVQSRDFTAVHDPGVINGVLEGGYIVNDMVTLFVGFTYSHANGDNHGAGRVSDPAGVFGPAGGVYELNANVSKYEAYQGRAGIKVTTPRYLLDLIHAPKAITPYFTASAGGKYIDAQNADFTAANFINDHVRLYDDSWVFTSQAGFGYNYKVTENFSVNLESGYGYDTKPERSGDRLPGVSGVNDGGDRLYSTVKLGAVVKF